MSPAIVPEAFCYVSTGWALGCLARATPCLEPPSLFSKLVEPEAYLHKTGVQALMGAGRAKSATG